VAVVVGYEQALQASPVGQPVADEVHSPHLLDSGGDVQRRALGHGAYDLRLRTAELVALYN
jgi:hypothetical protein